MRLPPLTTIRGRSGRGRAAVLLISILTIPACEAIVTDVAGETSARSFVVGDQFVILTNGSRKGDVTWAAVQNWPLSSSPEERRTDTRITLSPTQGWLIRRSDGQLVPPDREPRLYFFDRDKLTSFRMSLKENDFVDFRPATFKSYDEILGYFRRFEVHP